MLVGKRISWVLPEGTSVKFGAPKGKTLPYSLSNVKLADERRTNLWGLFSVWPNVPANRGENTIKLGHHKILIVSGAHNTNVEVEALEKLYRGISVVN